MTRAQVRALDHLPPIGAAVVTLGVFDGVHRGHAALLEAAARAAVERRVASVALVFDPPPDEVLRPGTIVPRLAPLATVLGRIEEDCGVDRALPVRFDDELRARSAEEFVAALAPALALRALVMSPDSAFGRGRGGTVPRMRELGQARGFEVITVEPVSVDGDVVSSSRIRAAIGAGQVEVARSLGYPPRLEGLVDATARLAFDYAPAMPAPGVYIARAAAPERGIGRGHSALVEVGAEGRVEAHLLDGDADGNAGRDVTGVRLELDLLHRLRDERSFASIEARRAQRQSDEAAARAWLERD